MSEHKPDLAKIAPPLQSLDWQPIDPARKWWDGTVLLLAVPILYPSPADFRYEYVVVGVLCDDRHGFEVYCEGELWGRDLDDADWYVVISE